MKFQMIKTAVAATVVAASLISATSASAATATATARAKVLRAVTIASNNVDLQFGTILPGAAAGVVTVDTSGVRTLCGAGLVCTSTTSAAGFNVTGTSGQVVQVSVPATVSLVDGTNTMTATLTSSSTTGLITMSATNAGSFSVGGSLAVGINQAEGVYAGVFTATANYQ